MMGKGRRGELQRFALMCLLSLAACGQWAQVAHAGQLVQGGPDLPAIPGRESSAWASTSASKMGSS